VKVLFVAGGKRVELARLFKERGHIVDAYELSGYVPIALEARRVISGYKCDDANFYNDIRELYHEYDLILPLHDTAVEALSGFVVEDISQKEFDDGNLDAVWLREVIHFENYHRFDKKICASRLSKVMIACDKERLANYCIEESWYPKPKLLQHLLLVD
jgi:hypothetical protein